MMSDHALVAGVLAGILFLPLVAGALLTGGLVAAVAALVAVVTVVFGFLSPSDGDTRDCLRCGESNDAENAVCEACQAQL